MKKLSWKNVLHIKMASVCRWKIEDACEMASKLKYEYFSWNEDVYQVINVVDYKLFCSVDDVE